MRPPPQLRPVLAGTGFECRSGVLAAHLRGACRDLAASAWESPGDDVASTWHDSVEVPARRLRLKLGHFLHRDPALRARVEHALAALAAEAFGGQVQLFADELHWREPATIGFGGHQPAVWLGWGLLAPRLVLTTVRLDESRDDVSGPQLAASVHQRGALDNFFHKAGCAGLDYEPVCMAPGDVLVHDGLTPLRFVAGQPRGTQAWLTLAWNAGADGDQRDRQHALMPKLRRHFTYRAWMQQFTTPPQEHAHAV